MEQTDELLALAEQLGDQRLAVQAYSHRASSAVEMGDLSAARQSAERQERLAAELGEPTLRCMAAVSASGLPLAAGQLQEAEDRAVAALSMGEHVESAASTFFVAHMFAVRQHQGRLEECSRSCSTTPPIPEFLAHWLVQAMVAYAYSEMDRPEDARPYYEPLAATGFTGLHFDNTWLPALAAFAEACVRVGDSASAPRLNKS